MKYLDFTGLTAQHFISELEKFKGETHIKKAQKYFKGEDSTTECLGLHMRTVFQLSKLFTDMPLDEVEKVLESPYYDARMGAISIMDFQAKKKKVTKQKRKDLFDLFVDTIELTIGILLIEQLPQ
ncbi:DNA alkylation repair protein [Anaerobacillus alkalilacustris]|uniref:DNA alkylation repair protein n=1 Tax=Anaerobacillus alkalilacustris TaxID=393763 RepID=UPI002481ECE1|nr:DNA alkylation repair protein [Anaerobacillus alkalilacustris]